MGSVSFLWGSLFKMLRVLVRDFQNYLIHGAVNEINSGQSKTGETVQEGERASFGKAAWNFFWSSRSILYVQILSEVRFEKWEKKHRSLLEIPECQRNKKDSPNSSSVKTCVMLHWQMCCLGSSFLLACGRVLGLKGIFVVAHAKPVLETLDFSVFSTQ